jgi:hypothetical protein
MEERSLAASTIDRRLFTACGFYRFAHIEGRIVSNPAQCVRRPPVPPHERRGLDRGQLARFLYTAERFDHAHAALADCDNSGAIRSEETQGGGPFDCGGAGVHPEFHVGVAQMGFYGVEGEVQFGCHLGLGQSPG